MNSDIRISQKNQELWIKKSYERKDYYHWIVQNKDEDVGFISIRDLDLVNKTSSWGFYIGEDSALGLGSITKTLLVLFCIVDVLPMKLVVR